VHYQQKLDIEFYSFFLPFSPKKEAKRTRLFLEYFLDEDLFTLYIEKYWF
jgi:hypothetical protein